MALVSKDTFTLGLQRGTQRVEHTRDSINLALAQYSITLYVPFSNSKRIITQCKHFFFLQKGHIKAHKYFIKPTRLATFAVPLFSQS